MKRMQQVGMKHVIDVEGGAVTPSKAIETAPNM
jgi:hypothetical protein